jgi:isopenicillin-N epimerase
MVTLLRDMAAFTNSDAADLAFMPNATSGLNTVMANVRLQPGREVLMLDVGYGAVKKIAASVCAAAGATLVQACVDLPVRCASVCR